MSRSEISLLFLFWVLTPAVAYWYFPVYVPYSFLLLLFVSLLGLFHASCRRMIRIFADPVVLLQQIPVGLDAFIISLQRITDDLRLNNGIQQDHILISRVAGLVFLWPVTVILFMTDLQLGNETFPGVLQIETGNMSSLLPLNLAEITSLAYVLCMLISAILMSDSLQSTNLTSYHDESLRGRWLMGCLSGIIIAAMLSITVLLGLFRGVNGLPSDQGQVPGISEEASVSLDFDALSTDMRVPGEDTGISPAEITQGHIGYAINIILPVVTALLLILSHWLLNTTFLFAVILIVKMSQLGLFIANFVLRFGLHAMTLVVFIVAELLFLALRVSILIASPLAALLDRKIIDSDIPSADTFTLMEKAPANLAVAHTSPLGEQDAGAEVVMTVSDADDQPNHNWKPF